MAAQPIDIRARVGASRESRPVRAHARTRETVTIDSPFPNQRAAALALLNGSNRLSRRAGGFLGQLAVDPAPLSAAQAGWLAKLLERANLPPLAREGAL